MNKKIYAQELSEWNLNTAYYEQEGKFPFQKIIFEEILAKSGLSDKNQTILDAGCAVGHLTNYVQQKTHSRVVGFDFAPEMITLAKEKYPKINFICASADKLPFKNQSFDAILAKGLLHHLKAQGILKEAIIELNRVLKSKGTFCAIDRYDTFFSNLSESVFVLIKTFLTKLKGQYSASSTTNEIAITKKDLDKLQDEGFKLVRQTPIYSLPHKILAVMANFILYTLGIKYALLFQKIFSPLVIFAEKKLNFNWLSIERCFVFQKR